MRTQMAIGVIAGVTAVAGAQLNLGSFEGAWNNTTFGSSGDAFMLVESLGGMDVSLTIDLDGFVFGAGNPDPFTITGTVGDMGFVADPFDDGGTFGDLSGGVDMDGNVSIDLMNAGNGAFSLITLRGTAVGDSVDLAYEIYTPNSSTAPFAVGTLEMDRVPAPGTMALFGLGGLLVTRRSR